MTWMRVLPAHLLVGALIPFAAGCAGRFAVPRGPAEPFPDGPSVWAGVTTRCRDLQSIRAELALAGRAGNRRIPGLAGARLGVAATVSGDVVIEARVSGQLAFKLAGRDDQSTLLLVADRRVVTARADELVEALVGVKLGARHLVSLLGGCGWPDVDAERFELVGRVVRVTAPSGVVYLTPRGTAWDIRAVESAGFLVDYRWRGGASPESVRLDSVPGRTPVVSLTLGVTAIDVNPQLPGPLFTVNVPAEAVPLSLDELRASGPLGPP